MTDEEKEKILEKHANELSEVFDAVQILACSLNQSGTTSSYKRGSGLWHARQGLALEFGQEDINEDAAIRIARRLDPPDDYAKA